MANLVDLANDDLIRQAQQAQSAHTTHDFSAIYVRSDGVVVSVGSLSNLMSDCYDWLEEVAGVDLEHGQWAFGSTAPDGSTTTKWNRPQMLTMLMALLAHPIG